MRVSLRERDCGACPYLEGRTWRTEEFFVASLDPAIYEELLAVGFRRSGHLFYRPACPSCARCVPLRLSAESFRPSKSQARLLRKNAEVGVRLVPAGYDEERYLLYRRYVAARHGEREAEPDREAYRGFLVDGPLATSAVAEYRLPDGRLVAAGYLDILPGGLSSVYFAFDPEESRRSLGTWSVLRELELAVSLGKPYYYLGFWVPGSPKMDYKAGFAPFEYARGGVWSPANDREEALAAVGAAGST
ncbi:MAG: arginyltransferase [Spirochaetaceae bacterium]|nr:arginyltransferase [Spirochaetaceae bacterium]